MEIVSIQGVENLNLKDKLEADDPGPGVQTSNHSLKPLFHTLKQLSLTSKH